MRELTKIERETLDQFYTEMEWYSLYGFTRSISRKRRSVLFMVYNDITGNNEMINTGCSRCINKMLGELWEWYNYKDSKKKEKKNDR